MSSKNIFGLFTGSERVLWLVSVLSIIGAFIFSGSADIFTAASSPIGVTALMLTAKGMPVEQALIVVFAALYGVASFRLSYYSEMITYLGMISPIVVFAFLSRLKHPFKNSAEIAVGRLTPA